MKIESTCWMEAGVAVIQLRVALTNLKLLKDEEEVMRVVKSNISILARISIRAVVKNIIVETLEKHGVAIEDVIAEEIINDLVASGVKLAGLKEPKEEGGESI